jgi:hypothetical protein
MPKARLTYSWIAAMATLPPEWQLMGVVRGPREVDPKIQSASWVTWARGLDGEPVEGQGESPEDSRSRSRNRGQPGLAARRQRRSQIDTPDVPGMASRAAGARLRLTIMRSLTARHTAREGRV